MYWTMDFLAKSVFFDLLIFNCSYCYVIISGGPYCSTDGYSVSYAIPGTYVSITCAVENPDNVSNNLTWSIPTFGVMLFNTAVDGTVDGTKIKSTVTHSDVVQGRVNATLSFFAVSVLNKTTVQCRNNDNPPQSRNCTLFILAYSSIIISGGPYCSTDGNSVSHAVPGTTVSITCAVDNPGGVSNSLTWSIPKYGVMLAHTGWDIPVAGTELKSIVTYSYSPTGRTNAILSFLAVSGLDEAIVHCRNNDNPPQSRNCTLFILAPPTAPTSFICTDITINSLTLQWGEPSDNGGEEVSQYNTTGTPGDISIVETGNTVTLENLLPNNKYHLTIKASNSVGFGNETSVECTTKEKTPPTAPVSFTCTDRTNNSLTLQWDEPSDNGGEVELQYNITGTPRDISIVEEGNMVTVENLLPNTTYNLSIRAGNSVGFGNEIYVECTTEEKSNNFYSVYCSNMDFSSFSSCACVGPPMFDNVMVCLDVSDTHPNSKAQLIVDYTVRHTRIVIMQTIYTSKSPPFYYV